MEKIKILLISIGLIIFNITASSQALLLLNEDFSGGNGSFTLNSNNIPGGSPSGPNIWIVNNQYTGNANFPSTTAQTNTTSGQITNPGGNYLHIHHQPSAPGVANSNYMANTASSQFAFTTAGVCTKGFTGVTFEFFWLAEGAAGAYGELFYSINNGVWVKVGANQYNNQSNWRQEIITNPAFDDVGNLKFGFKWTNNAGSQSNNLSFAIDDIFIYGNYKTGLSITTSAGASVCQGHNLLVSFTLSDTLCNGQYSIQLSDANGNFAGAPPTWGPLNVVYPNRSGAANINIPTTTPLGSCYRVRVVRTNAPYITGTSSACITIVQCPNTITTNQPVPTIGSQPPNGIPVCVNSVIDIPFWSTGTFQANNVYTAYLSDSSGSFLNNPQVIGTSNDSRTYNPQFVPNPGMVSGIIPATPDGCNYYIRVQSSNPATVGSVWGPFCIKNCDILTNNIIDLNFCIDHLIGDTTFIALAINTPPSNNTYAPGNTFRFQLLNSQTFVPVNTGSLGSIQTNTSNFMMIGVPNLPGLQAMGISPGMYYARIVADSGTPTNNQLGSLIRVTIGAPHTATPLNINYSPDTVVCVGSIVSLFPSPFNNQSKYQWFLNGNQFPPNDPRPALGVLFNGPGMFNFQVQETNFNCAGPMSNIRTIYVIPPPSAIISHYPPNVCQGDTMIYQVPFINNTVYNWNLSCGRIIDTSNNQITVVWDSLGSCTMNLSVLNKCGSDATSRTFNVMPKPIVTTSNDTNICMGDTIQLNATGAQTYVWMPNQHISNDFIANPFVYPLNTIQYRLRAIGSNGCVVWDTVTVTVTPSPAIDLGPDTIICTRTGLFLNAIGTGQITWQFDTSLSSTTIPNPFANPKQTTRYYAEIIDPISTCKGKDSVLVRVSQLVTYGTQSLKECYPAIIDLDAGNPGSFYQWSNGYATQSFFTQSSGLFVVTITDTLNCTLVDTYIVNIPIPLVYDNTIDSIEFCEGTLTTIGSSQIASYYIWNTGATTDSIRINSGGLYTIQLIDSNGCEAIEFIDVNMLKPMVRSRGTLNYEICDGEKIELWPMPGFSKFNWSTGETSTKITVVDSGTIFLDLMDLYGCTASDTFIVKSKGNCIELIYVPNTFSPNLDNLNDVFFPKYWNINEIELLIYNRWGELVFHSVNLSGWDGTQNGRPSPIGLYVWLIRYRDTKNQLIDKVGSLLLIR